MRQTSFTPIAILALNAGDEATEQSILAKAGFTVAKPMIGVYKGEEERSWLVPTTTLKHKRELLALAAAFDQESVLFSGMDRTTHLHYLADNKAEMVGVLGQVSEEFAKSKDCYTYDPEANAYYVAK